MGGALFFIHDLEAHMNDTPTRPGQQSMLDDPEVQAAPIDGNVRDLTGRVPEWSEVKFKAPRELMRWPEASPNQWQPGQRLVLVCEAVVTGAGVEIRTEGRGESAREVAVRVHATAWESKRLLTRDQAYRIQSILDADDAAEQEAREAKRQLEETVRALGSDVEITFHPDPTVPMPADDTARQLAQGMMEKSGGDVAKMADAITETRDEMLAAAGKPITTDTQDTHQAAQANGDADQHGDVDSQADDDLAQLDDTADQHLVVNDPNHGGCWVSKDGTPLGNAEAAELLRLDHADAGVRHMTEHVCETGTWVRWEADDLADGPEPAPPSDFAPVAARDTYTEAELDAMTDEQLRTILANHGVKLAGGDHDTLVSMVLTALDTED